MLITVKMEYIDPQVFVRARAEQLALAADAATFQELYVARTVNFGTEQGDATRDAYDAFIAPFRQAAIEQLQTVLQAANAAAKAAFSKVLNEGLSKAGLTGAHDATELSLTEQDVLKSLEAASGQELESITFIEPEDEDEFLA